MRLGGKVIDPGTMVILGLGSANRDPARWGDSADRLDLRREGASEHLSFGGGHHHCLGAALARLEAQEAIGRMVRRFGTIELDGEPAWNGRINLRGLSRLPVRVTA
jgi:cytochrome P450